MRNEWGCDELTVMFFFYDMDEVIVLLTSMIFKNEWGNYVLTAMILKNEWGKYVLTAMILKTWMRQLCFDIFDKNETINNI